MTEIKVVIASFSGALICILTRGYLKNRQKYIYFFVSFSMGVIGADAGLELTKILTPGIFSNERAIGAFVTSALIVNIIFKVIKRFETFQFGVDKKKGNNKKD